MTGRTRAKLFITAAVAGAVTLVFFPKLFLSGFILLLGLLVLVMSGVLLRMVWLQEGNPSPGRTALLLAVGLTGIGIVIYALLLITDSLPR